MSPDTNGILIFVVLVATVAVIAHPLVRRFWLSCWAVAIVCSLVNVGHEVVVHDFQIRPVDAVYWLPMDFVFGAFVAFPIACLVGLPFVLNGRRSRRLV